MINPRMHFAIWLDGRDPAAMEQLVLDLSACSPAAFSDVCALAGKLAQAQDIKSAVSAACTEVDKHPTKNREIALAAESGRK